MQAAYCASIMQCNKHTICIRTVYPDCRNRISAEYERGKVWRIAHAREPHLRGDDGVLVR